MIRHRTQEEIEADLEEAARVVAQQRGVPIDEIKFGGPPSTKYPVYATVADVESLNRARTLGTNNTPTAEDAQLFLELSAAEIDSILMNKGYVVPIETTSKLANMLLCGINAKGAIVRVEKGSPTAPKLEQFEKEYEEELEKLRSAEFTLDAPQATERARPRGPGLTTPQASGLESSPFFSRSQEF